MVEGKYDQAAEGIWVRFNNKIVGGIRFRHMFAIVPSSASYLGRIHTNRWLESGKQLIY